MKKPLNLNRIIEHPLFDVGWFSSILLLKYIFFFKEIEIPNQLYFTSVGKNLTFITLIIIGLFFWFLKSRSRKISLISINTILSIGIFADILYYRHFKDITSFSLLFQLNQVGDIKGSIIGLIHGWDILYFMDILLLVSFLIFKRADKKEKKKYNVNRIIVVSMLLSIGLFLNLSYGLKITGDIEKRNSNSITAVFIGAINYHLIESSLSIKEKIFKPTLSEKELEKIKDSFKQTKNVEPLPYEGLVKGKNILFVQMESFSQFVVQQKIEGKEITPHLNKLIQESYYNDHFYSQISDGHSSDAEFVTLNSLYPLQKGSVSTLYGFNDYEALPEILSKQGYATFSAHGYRSEFWNRVNTHKSYGFQESYFDKQFDIRETAGFGMKDSDFFVQSVQKLTTLKKPFFSYFITLQNHLPFDVKDTSFNVGNYEGTILGNYIQSVHEADKAIGVLIEELKKAGLYDNTLLVLFGDHDAELSEEEMKKWRLPLDTYEMRYQELKKVPLVIHSPHNELIQVDHQPLGQMDIMPSILHLAGISSENIPMVGKNLFDFHKNHTVGRMDNTMITNDYFFASDTTTNQVVRKAWKIETGEEIEVTPEMIQNFEYIQEQIENSNLLIKNDAIKKLKKEGEHN